MCYSARSMMKLGMLLNRLICDAYAKFRVSSFKNVVTITADTHTHIHTYIQVDRIPDFFFSQVIKTAFKNECKNLTEMCY